MAHYLAWHRSGRVNALSRWQTCDNAYYDDLPLWAIEAKQDADARLIALVSISIEYAAAYHGGPSLATAAGRIFRRRDF